MNTEFGTMTNNSLMGNRSAESSRARTIASDSPALIIWLKLDTWERCLAAVICALLFYQLSYGVARL